MKTDLKKRPITQRTAKALHICKEPHGHEGNPATVYGHHGSSRTCIKVKSTEQWVFDPAWETRE